MKELAMETEKWFDYINSKSSCYSDAINKLPCHCNHPEYTRLYSNRKPPLLIVKEWDIQLELYTGYMVVIECPWCHAIASIPISEDLYNEIYKLRNT